MELFKDFGIWKIVAHIAFKFYSGASETFSTGSTFALRRGACFAGAWSGLLGDVSDAPVQVHRAINPPC